MNGRTTALTIAGLVGLGIFAADIGARSQSPGLGESWAIHSGSAGEAWKLNTRTGELYHCIAAQAQPKVVCSK